MSLSKRLLKISISASLTLSSQNAFSKADYSSVMSKVNYLEVIETLKANSFHEIIRSNEVEGEKIWHRIPLEKEVSRIQTFCESENSKVVNAIRHENNSFMTITFDCQKTNPNEPGKVHSIQAITSLNMKGQLLDVQVIDQTLSTETQSADSPLKEALKVSAGISLGTLGAGLLAHGIFPGQEDKFKHAIAGSITAAMTTLIAHYGLKMDKDKSMWAGIAAALVVGIAKEVYDKRSNGKHTPDGKDALVTAFGGLASVGFRLSIDL